MCENFQTNVPDTPITVHPQKDLRIEVDGQVFERWAVKTHVVQNGDDLEEIISTYAAPHLQSGDMLFLSEKMVACTQGRAIPLKDIRPCRLARFLCRFVRKTSYGIGLAMPETMEMAIRECGRLRILLAACAGLMGKLSGRRGWFYIVAGRKAAAIDGPCAFTLPPYNEYVVLAPHHPDAVAKKLSDSFHCPVLIVDINDLGGEILGTSSPSMDRTFYASLLRDNPLEQSSECTPIGILRPVQGGASPSVADQ